MAVEFILRMCAVVIAVSRLAVCLRSAYFDMAEDVFFADRFAVTSCYIHSLGLASVIGLLLLARRRGQVVDGVERVTWISKAGRERAASVPRLLFTSEAGEHRQAEGAVHAGQPT